MIDQEIVEECGVFGVYNIENASKLVYYGLHSLQHRGQEGCGIISVNNNEFYRHKGQGLVTETISEENLKYLRGKSAIGHVLYAKACDCIIENVQPLLFHQSIGDFAISYNGCIVNIKEIKDYLEEKGCIFQTNSDAELLANLIKLNKGLNFLESLSESLNMIDGAFSFAFLTNDKIYCCRDKYGIKPLAIGQINGGYVVSSETCAFEVVGAKYIRDVLPGEIIILDNNGISSYEFSKFKKHKMCAMEYIYFSRPDSNIDKINVHAFRKLSGKILFQESPVDADICIGVPDSSLSAAIGYSEESKIPYELGLIKNKYIGRTFIQPNQEMREKGVKMKLSAVSSIVNGKRIVLVDDSIVRGTTSKKIIGLLREAGATEVHVRIASMVFSNPCYYGVDTATYEELIATNNSVEEIRKIIGADSLCYLSKEGLLKAAMGNDLCLGCFTGIYPTPLFHKEKRRK